MSDTATTQEPDMTATLESAFADMLGGSQSATPESTATETTQGDPGPSLMDEFDIALGLKEKPDEKQADTPEETPKTDDSAAKTDDDDPYPDTIPNATEKAQAKWGEIKSDLKKTRAELRAERDKAAAEIKAREEALAQREKELEELRQKVVELPELSEKAKYAEEAERELAIARVEGTKEYKETILRPLEAIEQAAEVIAKANELSVDDVLDALTERDPGKRDQLLEELTASLKPIHQLKMVRMAEDAQQLLMKRDQMREKAVEAKKEIEALNERKMAETKQQALKKFQDSVEHAAKALQERFPFIELEDGETADALFRSVADKVKATDFDSLNPDAKGFAAVSGLALARAVKQMTKLIEENKTLKARISESNSVQPTVGAGADAAGADNGRGFIEGIFSDLGMSHELQ